MAMIRRNVIRIFSLHGSSATVKLKYMAVIL